MVARDAVIGITMNDPQIFTLGGFMTEFIHNLDITHFKIVLGNILAQEFIVITNHVKKVGLFLFRFAQDLPNHAIVCAGPVPLGGGNAPAIDDVSYQKQVLATMGFQKTVEKLGFAAFGAEVNI